MGTTVWELLKKDLSALFPHRPKPIELEHSPEKPSTGRGATFEIHQMLKNPCADEHGFIPVDPPGARDITLYSLIS